MIIAKQKSRNLAMMLVMVMLFGLLPMTSPLVAEADGKTEGPYITVTGKVYNNENEIVTGEVYSGIYTIGEDFSFTVSEKVYLATEQVDEKDKAEVKIGENTVTGIVYTNDKITVTGNLGEAVKVTLTSAEDKDKVSTFTFIVGEESENPEDPVDPVDPEDPEDPVVEVKDGKVDLSELVKLDKDGKTKPETVPIKVREGLSIWIHLPALNLGDEQLILEIKEIKLQDVTKPVTALEITVPGNDGKVSFTLTLPIPSGLENKSIAGFHKSGNRWEYRKAARQDNNAIFDTNLSAVAVGEAVEIPEIKKVVSTTKNSVTLEVYSTVKDATFEFFAGNNKLTATKVNGKDNQYSITGLAAGTTYNITARAIDAEGFESDLSKVVTVTTDKKSSSGGGGGGSSSSTNEVSYNRSATIESRGVTVEIPANAMNQDFKVEVTRVSSTSRLPMPSNMKFAGDVFEITKNVDGDFDKDVTITLPYDKSKVDFDKYDVSLFWLNEKTDKWVELDDIRVNKSSETVRGEVDHFTKFAVLAIEKGTEIEIEKDDEVEEIVLSLRDIKGHWAETHITKLIDNGAISGYPDGTFKPDNNITRAEFATVLVKALDLEETTGKVFNDTANHWARKYIATAEANGIVSGYSTTTFGADDLITREQMAVMIVKAAKLSNTTPYTEFADAKKISSWAKSAVDTASYNDIIKGYPDGTFGPQKSATRAEAVTVIGKVL